MNTLLSILGIVTLTLLVVAGFLFSLRWWVQHSFVCCCSLVTV